MPNRIAAAVEYSLIGAKRCREKRSVAVALVNQDKEI